MTARGGVRRAALLLAAALVVAPTVATVATAPPAVAAGDPQPCSEIQPTDDATDPDNVDSAPVTSMKVLDAVRYELARDRVSGTGVTVAVVDSGIASIPGIAVSARTSGTDRGGEPDDGHGTVVAGLIAGKPKDGKLVGVAPGASLVAVRAYDKAEPEDGSDEVDLNPTNLASALQKLLGLMANTKIDIVNVSLALDRDEKVAGLIEQIQAAGAIVVAPSGDRSLEYLADLGPYDGSEDVADRVFPAGYDGVVAVSTTPDGATVSEGGESDPGSPPPSDDESTFVEPDDPSTVMFANSRTTLAAPSAGAISYAANGDLCRVDQPSSDWATAEVTGLLAMLKTTHRGDTNAQLVARLVQTASGLAGDPTPFVGQGIVQPYEALTQPLRLKKDGSPVRPPSRPEVREGAVADPPTDPLDGTRDDVVWWALAGGGGLALMLLLAPVLSRRRRRVVG